MADTLVIDLDSLVCAKDNTDKARGQVDQIKGSVPLATVATAMPSGTAGGAAASAGSRVRTLTGSRRGSQTRSSLSLRHSRGL